MLLAWGVLELAAIPAVPLDATTPGPAQRWTAERARVWYQTQPWLCGFNYIPANDINYTEMWMGSGFDPAVIAHELALAPPIGFNCVRVVLSYVDWQGDRAGFLQRFDDFLNLCQRNGLRVLPCFFDDCAFGPLKDPIYGPQPKLVPGWYANAWSPSPGHKTVVNVSAFPDLQRYVQDVVGAHQDDPRVLGWDLYNEAGNSGMGGSSFPLLRAVFGWARAIGPRQPITSGVYNLKSPLTPFLLSNSDVITFHCYARAAELQGMINRLRSEGRPLICTEWLNRNGGSIPAACLPVFERNDVGCLSWGLVNGRTQTNLNWGHRPGQPDPPHWQHDLYRGDFTPNDPAEIASFQHAIVQIRQKASGQ